MADDGVLLNFGDVFTYNSEDYIYLAESPESGITYAARILDKERSREVKTIIDKDQYKPGFKAGSLVYSFVVLTSMEFRERLAWFRDAGKDGAKGTRPHSALENEDLAKIKEEILTQGFPEELKEKIRLTTPSEL